MRKLHCDLLALVVGECARANDQSCERRRGSSSRTLQTRFYERAELSSGNVCTDESERVKYRAGIWF